jgi:hypothetical protein
MFRASTLYVALALAGLMQLVESQCTSPPTLPTGSQQNQYNVINCRSGSALGTTCTVFCGASFLGLGRPFTCSRVNGVNRWVGTWPTCTGMHIAHNLASDDFLLRVQAADCYSRDRLVRIRLLHFLLMLPSGRCLSMSQVVASDARYNYAQCTARIVGAASCPVTVRSEEVSFFRR